MVHKTTTPKQAQSDRWAVFRVRDDLNNLELIGRVHVPTHTQPNSDGRQLERYERHKLAVWRAVTDEEAHIEGPDGYRLNETELHRIDGEEFMVMTSLEDAMQFALFEAEEWYHNVWFPEDDQ